LQTVNKDFLQFVSADIDNKVKRNKIKFSQMIPSDLPAVDCLFEKAWYGLKVTFFSTTLD
jgi:hypothetical protein